MRARWPAWLAALWIGAVQADVTVCFNYGCADSAAVHFASAPVDEALGLLDGAGDAAGEREAIAKAVGLLYREAGRQTPIAADRAGNFLDQGVEGRMDCIDHSATTTRLLELIAARGGLRFHRVLEPARRTRLLFQHYSAAIEEIEPQPRPAEPAAMPVPDHVPYLLALCDCPGVLDDIPRAPPPVPVPPGQPGARFAVDSWFVDHGEPAVILPLAEWLNGEGPNVQ